MSATEKRLPPAWRAALIAGWVLAGPALAAAAGSAPAAPAGGLPVWIWPAALFVVCLAIGIVAVLAGVGGGVLFVPLVSSFFPFHLDFVRCAGLFVALAGSISAAPDLLRKGLADLRLAMPLALAASFSSIFGALVGLRLPTHVAQVFLGVAILGIAAVMAFGRNADHPAVASPGLLAVRLGIGGRYHEQTGGTDIDWRAHRFGRGLLLFLAIGFLAGMFGLGAGWANVPAINMFMGAPLKLAVATSGTVIAVTDSTAAWIYLNSGAALPAIVAPSIAGMTLGARVGARLLTRAKPRAVRSAVLAILFFAGLRALMRGVTAWRGAAA